MVKKLKWNLVLMSALYLGLGVFLLMKPTTALNIVCYALGAVVLACAAVLLFMRGAGYSYGGYWFACCNLLVGGSNLLPLPGLDGWRIAGALHGIGRT